MKYNTAARITVLCTAFSLLFLAGAPCLADEWNDSFSPPRPYRVLRDIAVRSGPANKHERLGSVSEGDVLRVHEIVNGWNRFDFQGRQGWLFKRYLRPMAAGEPEQLGQGKTEPAPREQPHSEDPRPPAAPDTAVSADPDVLAQALAELAKEQVPASPDPGPAPNSHLPPPQEPPAAQPAEQVQDLPDGQPRLEIEPGLLLQPGPLEPETPVPPLDEPVQDLPEKSGTPLLEIEPGLPLQPAPPAPTATPSSLTEQPKGLEASPVLVEPETTPQSGVVEPETPPLPPDALTDESETPPMEEEADVPPLPSLAAPAASARPGEEEGTYVAALQPLPEPGIMEPQHLPKRTPHPAGSHEHGCERFISILPEEKPGAGRTAVLQGELSPGGQACYRLLTLADWNVSALLKAPEGASFDIFTPDQGRIAASMRAWAQLMQNSGDKYFVIHAGEASGAFTFELTVR